MGWIREEMGDKILKTCTIPSTKSILFYTPHLIYPIYALCAIDTVYTLHFVRHFSSDEPWFALGHCECYCCLSLGQSPRIFCSLHKASNSVQRERARALQHPVPHSTRDVAFRVRDAPAAGFFLVQRPIFVLSTPHLIR